MNAAIANSTTRASFGGFKRFLSSTKTCTEACFHVPSIDDMLSCKALKGWQIMVIMHNFEYFPLNYETRRCGIVEVVWIYCVAASRFDVFGIRAALHESSRLLLPTLLLQI